MQPQQTPTRPKLFSQCSEFGFRSAPNGQKSVIIWSADDKIGIYRYDPKTLQYTSVVVEAYPKEMSNVIVNLGMLTFHVRGRVYAANFDPNAMLVLAASGVAGTAINASSDSFAGDLAGTGVSIAGGLHADNMPNDSGIDEWTAALKASGVVVETSMRKPTMSSIKIALIACAVIIPILFIMSVFMTLTNQ